MIPGCKNGPINTTYHFDELSNTPLLLLLCFTLLFGSTKVYVRFLLIESLRHTKLYLSVASLLLHRILWKTHMYRIQFQGIEYTAEPNYL
jgi:hypothetical protein